MTKQLTKLEILTETYEFYAKNPQNRALNGNTCVYKRSDNGVIKHCAVGRCIDPSKESEFPIFITSNSSIRGIFGEIHSSADKLNNILLPQYQGHDVNFWADLQQWHDKKKHWDILNNKITEEGENFMKELVTKYSEN